MHCAVIILLVFKNSVVIIAYFEMYFMILHHLFVSSTLIDCSYATTFAMTQCVFYTLSYFQ